MIILTISEHAANLVGSLSSRAHAEGAASLTATLHQAEYSVIRQEGMYGFTGSLTVPLEPDNGLTWQGVKNCLEMAGCLVEVKA